MHKKSKQILLVILLIMLCAELVFVGLQHLQGKDAPSVGIIGGADGETQIIISGEPTIPSSRETRPVPTDTFPDPTQTDQPSAPTQPSETEPGEQHFVLSFAGDCTFGSTANRWNSPSGFIKVVGTNYDYPFANVVNYFENDDFTMVNLEGPLTESGKAAAKTFAFKGPTAYTEILTGSSVEAVNLANNHSEDYGKQGYESTARALGEAGVTYVEKNDTAMFTTKSGLKIGLYAGSFNFSKSDIRSDIAKLRKDGAEIVIAAYHWGNEGKYRPNSNQEYFAKVTIDAGADIVFGQHPHVLQKIEKYKDGIIMYSMGNFSFGGTTFPQDYDTAIVQQEVIRDRDGKISLGEMTIIPCSMSSIKTHNNFQPTPLEEGSEAYKRVLSKLDGSFKGPDLVVDYGKLDPTETTEPSETTKPSDPTDPSETTKPADPTDPSETTKPSDPTVPPETTKPADPTVPPETTKPADSTVPPETTKPADPTVPPETTKPADPTVPPETTKPADPTVPPETTNPSPPADGGEGS